VKRCDRSERIEFHPRLLKEVIDRDEHFAAVLGGYASLSGYRAIWLKEDEGKR
jgi:hypothetical protein